MDDFSPACDDIPPALQGLALAPGTATTLQRQLFDSLQHRIIQGQLRPNSRLPSSRALAKALGVSRITVVQTFERLQAEGYLQPRRGQGTFVSPQLPDDAAPANAEGIPALDGEGPAPRPSRRGQALLACHLGARGGALPLLAPGVPAVDLFPFAAWGRLAGRFWRRRPWRAMGYGDPRGYLPLREAIVDYLGTARGVACTPEQVIVVAGTQQGVGLAAQALLDPGEPAWVEEPGYRAALVSLAHAGVRRVPVAVDGEGLNPQLGWEQAPRARLAMVAPSHQYPLGVTLSLPRRLALLAWARQAGAWIVEDDYDSEYRYRGAPLLALHQLDGGRRVIYLGSFSKVLHPGLRLGYVVVPEDLVDVFAALRGVSDRHSPLETQGVMAEFMASNQFSGHVRRLRTASAERAAALVAALHRHGLDRWLTVAEPTAGLHLVARLHPGAGVGDDVALATNAAEGGLRTPALSAHYSHHPRQQGLLLGFAATPPGLLDEAVQRLKQLWVPRGQG